MSNDMVTVAQFFDLNAAYLLRSRLEAEGLSVWLENEMVTGLNDPAFLGGPGALLKVPAEDAARAAEIMRGETAEDSDPEDLSSALPISTLGYRNGLRLLAFMTALSALGGLILYLIQGR